jgi:hypothetical protein
VFGRKQVYWSSKTGKVVAEVIYSDQGGPGYCNDERFAFFETFGDTRVVKSCEAALAAAPNLCQTYLPDAAVGTDADGGTDADAGSAGRFACGSTATCDGRSQICEHVQGGAPPGVDIYDCLAVPAACQRNVSCACVGTALAGRGATTCAAASGNLTVQINVP